MVSGDAKPKLPRGVRLTHNEAQGGWVLLAPERVFKADAIAAEIVKRCTGEATVNDIVDDLAPAEQPELGKRARTCPSSWGVRPISGTSIRARRPRPRTSAASRR